MIKKLAVNKVPGRDLIEVLMIKKLAGRPGFVSFLTDMYNMYLQLSVFPVEWKSGLVIALLKDPSRVREDPGSYRPICLLSVFGKLLEKIIKIC